MANIELLKRLDAAIAGKNLLKHPFYQDWQAGKLSKEGLQLYAAQYYRHVEAFPKHLRVLAARTDGSLRELVLQNLAEEENPAMSHPKLWRDFAAALGVNEDDIRCCPALPGTQAVVEKFREICGDRPWPRPSRHCTPTNRRSRKWPLRKWRASTNSTGSTGQRRSPISRCMKRSTKSIARRGAVGWKSMRRAMRTKF